MIEFYQCATAVVSKADCNSPSSFQNLATSIMSECAGGGGAALDACEDYIQTVKDCISLAFTDPLVAAQARNALDGACAGTGAVSGQAEQNAIDSYECARDAILAGSCETMEGYAATLEQAARECFPETSGAAECP